MFVTECSSEYSNKIWNKVYCQYFTELFPISTLRVASYFQVNWVNHHYESLELVFLCLKIYLQNCKFWSMLKVSWREKHPVQFIKAPQMARTGILQLRKLVDFVTTTTSHKKHWISVGAKSQNWGDTCTCSLPKEGPFVRDRTNAS